MFIMTRKPAKSVVAAEKRALAGDNESQDSLEAFEQIRLNHAVGMVSGCRFKASVAG